MAIKSSKYDPKKKSFTESEAPKKVSTAAVGVGKVSGTQAPKLGAVSNTAAAKSKNRKSVSTINDKAKEPIVNVAPMTRGQSVYSTAKQNGYYGTNKATSVVNDKSYDLKFSPSFFSTDKDYNAHLANMRTAKDGTPDQVSTVSSDPKFFMNNYYYLSGSAAYKKASGNVDMDGSGQLTVNNGDKTSTYGPKVNAGPEAANMGRDTKQTLDNNLWLGVRAAQSSDDPEAAVMEQLKWYQEKADESPVGEHHNNMQSAVESLLAYGQQRGWQSFYEYEDARLMGQREDAASAVDYLQGEIDANKQDTDQLRQNIAEVMTDTEFTLDQLREGGKYANVGAHLEKTTGKSLNELEMRYTVTEIRDLLRDAQTEFDTTEGDHPEYSGGKSALNADLATAEKAYTAADNRSRVAEMHTIANQNRVRDAEFRNDGKFEATAQAYIDSVKSQPIGAENIVDGMPQMSTLSQIVLNTEAYRAAGLNLEGIDPVNYDPAEYSRYERSYLSNDRFAARYAEQMTDDERMTYAYIASKQGEAAAEAWFKDLAKYELAERDDAAQKKKWREAALSRRTTLAGNVSYGPGSFLGNMGRMIATGIAELASPLAMIAAITDTGNDIAGSDNIYSPYNDVNEWRSTTRAAVGESLTLRGGLWGVEMPSWLSEGSIGQFFVGQIGSMVDNVVRYAASAATMGTASAAFGANIGKDLIQAETLSIMFSDVTMSSYYNSVQNGMSPEMAMANAVVDGAIELATETVLSPDSMAFINAMQEGTLGSLCASMIAEGTEELESYWLGVAKDYMLNNEDQVSEVFNQFLNEGSVGGDNAYSYALWHTIGYFAGHSMLDFAGGALSVAPGGVSSIAKNAVNNLINNWKVDNATGEQLAGSAGNEASYLVQTALQQGTAKEKKAAEKILAAMDKDGVTLADIETLKEYDELRAKFGTKETSAVGPVMTDEQRAEKAAETTQTTQATETTTETTETTETTADVAEDNAQQEPEKVSEQNVESKEDVEAKKKSAEAQARKTRQMIRKLTRQAERAVGQTKQLLIKRVGELHEQLNSIKSNATVTAKASTEAVTEAAEETASAAQNAEITAAAETAADTAATAEAEAKPEQAEQTHVESKEDAVAEQKAKEAKDRSEKAQNRETAAVPETETEAVTTPADEDAELRARYEELAKHLQPAVDWFKNTDKKTRRNLGKLFRNVTNSLGIAVEKAKQEEVKEKLKTVLGDEIKDMADTVTGAITDLIYNAETAAEESLKVLKDYVDTHKDSTVATIMSDVAAGTSNWSAEGDLYSTETKGKVSTLERLFGVPYASTAAASTAPATRAAYAAKNTQTAADAGRAGIGNRVSKDDGMHVISADGHTADITSVDPTGYRVNEETGELEQRVTGTVTNADGTKEDATYWVSQRNIIGTVDDATANNAIRTISNGDAGVASVLGGSWAAAQAGGMDGPTWTNMVTTAYLYGRSGVSMENTMKALDGVVGHVEDAVKAAHESGTESAKKTRNKVRVIGKQKGKKTTLRYDNGVKYDNLDDASKAAVRIMKRFADAGAVNVVITDSSDKVDAKGRFTEKNGSYVGNTNTIYVDVTAGRKGVNDGMKAFMAGTFSHELTHYIQAWNADGYQKLVEIVSDYMASKNGTTFDDLVANEMSRIIEGNTRNLSETDIYDRAVDEVVAQACELMLDDNTIFDQIAKEDKTLAQKILDFIKDLINDIKEAFSGMEPDTVEAQIIKENVETFDKLQKQWTKALVDAMNTSIEEHTSEVEGDGIRVSNDVAEYMESDNYVSPNERDQHRTIDAWADSYKKTYGESQQFQVLLGNMKAFNDQILRSDTMRYMMPHGVNFNVDERGNLNTAKGFSRQGKDYGKSDIGSLRSNVEYGFTFDLDTKCERTYQYLALRGKIENMLGRRITSLEARQLIGVMRCYGYAIPCTYCYVEGKRMNLVDQYNKVLAAEGMQHTGRNIAPTDIFRAVEESRTIIDNYMNDRFGSKELHPENWKIDESTRVLNEDGTVKFEGYNDFWLPSDFNLENTVRDIMEENGLEYHEAVAKAKDRVEQRVLAKLANMDSIDSLSDDQRTELISEALEELQQEELSIREARLPYLAIKDKKSQKTIKKLKGETAEEAEYRVNTNREINEDNAKLTADKRAAKAALDAAVAAVDKHRAEIEKAAADYLKSHNIDELDLSEKEDKQTEDEIDEEIEVAEEKVPEKTVAEAELVKAAIREYNYRNGAQTMIGNTVSEWVNAMSADVPFNVNYSTDELKSDTIDGDLLALHNRATAAAQGGVKANVVKDYKPYVDEISRITVDEKRNMNARGGIRIHSSNDFQLGNIIDYLQFFGDLAGDQRGGFGHFVHTYSKNPIFANIFSRFGARINMSIAMYTVDGKVVENKSEGMMWEIAKKLRSDPATKGNCGTMAMVTDNAQLEFAMNADWIDMIIPFHSSGMPNQMFYDVMGWLNYTSIQGEKMFNATEMWQQIQQTEWYKEKTAAGEVIKKPASADMQAMYDEAMGIDEAHQLHKKGKGGKPGARYAPHFLPGSYTDEQGNEIPGWHDPKNPDSDAQRYLDLCKEYGVKPRFQGLQIKEDDAHGGQVVDITEHHGYIKLIKEAARTDTEQQYISVPQDEETWKLIREQIDSFGGYESFNNDWAHLAEKFVNTYAGKVGTAEDKLAGNAEFTVGEYDDIDQEMFTITNKDMTDAFYEDRVARQEKLAKFLQNLENVKAKAEAAGKSVPNALGKAKADYYAAANPVKVQEAQLANEEADNPYSSGDDTSDTRYSARVTDEGKLDMLNSQEYETTYRSMQVIDGKLYPPMAAKVNGKFEDPSEIGVWEMAVEHPEKAIERYDEKKGYSQFKLEKGNGKSIYAAYNPYMHSSNVVLNDQFSEAYKRPNLVVVECRVPVSEANGAYRAEYAKDGTGWHDWKAGPVATKVRQATGMTRRVYLSRYLMPVRILDYSEVASMYADILNGTDIAVPDNVVPPALLDELKKIGIPIKESGLVKAEEDDVRYQARGNASSIKEQIGYHVEELNSMDPVFNDRVNVPDYENRARTIEWVMNLLEYTGYKIERDNFGTVVFDKPRISRSLSYLKTSAEIAAFAALPNVISSGIRIDDGEHDSHKYRGFATFTFAAPVEINGVRGNMAAVVTETTDKFYKTHRILMPDGSVFDYLGTEKESEYSDGVGAVSSSIAQRDSLSANSITHGADDVNTENAEDVRDKARNSEGTELTPGQAEYFRESKIVDEDGNLQVIYHGTGAEFYEFDTSVHGGKTGRVEGFGIYLTDTEGVADSYGSRVIKGYANIVRPATSWQKTIKRSELIKLIKAAAERHAWEMTVKDGYDDIASALKDSWVSNYVDTYSVRNMDAAYRDVADQVLSTNDNDKDIVQEIMAGMAIRTYDAANDFYENVLTPTTGIDGFVTRWKNDQTGSYAKVVLAFNSNQVKDIDNANPTDAADIRFKDRTDPIVTDRQLAQMASDAVAETETEREYLKKYKAAVSLMTEKGDLIKQLTASLYETQDEYKQDGIRYKIAYERKLYDNAVKRTKNLEREQPLQDVLAKIRSETENAVYEALAVARDSGGSIDVQEALKAQQERYEKQIKELKKAAKGKQTVPADQAALIKRLQKQIDALKIAHDTQMAKELEKRKSAVARAKEGMRDRRESTELRQRIRRIIDDFNNRIAHPKPGHYVPKEMLSDLVQAMEAFDLSYVRNGEEVVPRAIQDIRAVYERYKDNSGIGLVYSPVISNLLVSLEETLQDKKFRNLTKNDLQMIANVMTALHKTIIDSNKAKAVKYAHDLHQIAKAMVDETGHAKVAIGKLGEIINEQMTPDNMFNRLGGWKKNSAWNSVQEALVDAEETKLATQREFVELFSDLTDRKEFKDLTKWKKDDLIDVGLTDMETGEAIPITKGFALALYMHLSSEDNMMGIARGGLTIPNFAKFYGGHADRAYNGIGSHRTEGASQRMNKLKSGLIAQGVEAAEIENAINGSREQIEEEFKGYLYQVRNNIEQFMGDYEHELVKRAHEWFDVRQRQKLNEITMDMYGFEKAVVPGYFPIHRDMNFVKHDIETVSRDINLENVGFMKERVKSSAPVMLTDFAFEMDSNVQKTSQYIGFVRALRDFNGLYNSVMGGMTTSVREVIANTLGTGKGAFGKTATAYIDKYITDLTGGEQVSQSVFAAIRRNMPRATLSLNPRVALSQLASILTAAAELGWSSVTKGIMKGIGTAFSTAQKNEIAGKNVWFWQRYMGEGGMTEFADAKSGSNAIDRAWNTAAKSKVGSKLLNWCQDMDVAATAILYRAAEEWATDNTGYSRGTEQWQQAVDDKYRETLRRTQPMYTPTERSDLMRNNNEVMKFFTMYKTQATQNLNTLYGAIAEYSQRVKDLKNGVEGVTSEDVVSSRKRLANSVAAIGVAAVTFAVMRFLVNALMGKLKKYRDDEDELTVESILGGVTEEAASSLTSMVMWGDVLYDAASAAITGDKYWGIEDSAIGQANDLLDSLVKLAQNDDPNKTWDLIHKVISNVTGSVGIPLGNVEGFVSAGDMWVKDIANGSFGSFEASVSRTAAQEYNRAIYAAIDGDADTYEELITGIMEGQNKNRKNALSGVVSRITELYKNGTITTEEATKVLTDEKYGINLNEEDFFWQLEKMEYAKKNGDTSGYSKLDRMQTVLETGADYEVKDAIQWYKDHGYSASQVDTAIKNSLKALYLDDKLTWDQVAVKAQDYLFAGDEPEKLQNDLYWLNDEFSWAKNDDAEYGESYSKYGDLQSAMDGMNLAEVLAEIERLMSHGVKKTSIASQISNAYKEDWIALNAVDPAKAQQMLDQIIIPAYVAAGYGEASERRYIAKKWK